MRNRQVPKPIRLDQLAIALRRLRHLVELADALLGRNLPGAGRTGEDAVVGIGDSRACVGGQTRVIGKPPQQRMRIQ
jgi:hypothetical protein